MTTINPDTKQKLEAYAALNNTNKVKESNTSFYMTLDGKILDLTHTYENGEIHEVDAYGGILRRFTFNVDVFLVNRYRETITRETWELVK